MDKKNLTDFPPKLCHQRDLSKNLTGRQSANFYASGLSNSLYEALWPLFLWKHFKCNDTFQFLAMDLAVLKVKPHYISLNPFRRQVIGDAYGQTFYTTWDCFIKKREIKRTHGEEIVFSSQLCHARPLVYLHLKIYHDSIIIAKRTSDEGPEKNILYVCRVIIFNAVKNMLTLNLCKIYNDGNGMIKMWWLVIIDYRLIEFLKLSRVCVFLSDQFVDLLIWGFDDMMI